MSTQPEQKRWWVYQGTGEPHDGITHLEAPPPWRKRHGGAPPPRLMTVDGKPPFVPSAEEIEMVNAALLLRRPLLITGKPGTGKSTLARAVTHELQLGEVLTWPITTNTTLQDGLYRYDAIARLQEVAYRRESGKGIEEDISPFLHLGPLGTAMAPSAYPRVLLIDEIDKSDIDLPNNLLNIFEEGQFEVHPLSRQARRKAEKTGPQPEKTEPLRIRAYDSDELIVTDKGWVRAYEFPLVIMTSNNEREFPPAFLRRCLRLELQEPTVERLEAIVTAHLGKGNLDEARELVTKFLELRKGGTLATDQLLNAIYLATRVGGPPQNKKSLIDTILRRLEATGTP